MDGVKQKRVFLLFLCSFVYHRKVHLSGRNPKLHFNFASKVNFPHYASCTLGILDSSYGSFFYPDLIGFIWAILYFSLLFFLTSMGLLGLMSSTFILLMAWWNEKAAKNEIAISKISDWSCSMNNVSFSKGDQCRKDFWSAGIWGFVPSERRLLL